MKPGMMKYLGHEAEYVSIVTVALIVLSVLVFPIFIALLPVMIVIGCSAIWSLDHIKDKT